MEMWQVRASYYYSAILRGRDTPQLPPASLQLIILLPCVRPVQFPFASLLQSASPKQSSMPRLSFAPAVPRTWTPKTDGIRSVWADRTLLRCYRSDIHHYGRGNPAGDGISPLDFHCK